MLLLAARRGARIVSAGFVLTEDLGMRLVFQLAAVALVFAAAAGGAHAQLKKSDTVVKAEAKADAIAADNTQAVTITLTIDKGWHTYANPVENPDLVDTQTSV